MVPIGRGPAAADSQAHPLQFDCHRLAGPHGPLSSSGREVKLTPKALALLWTLASHPGRVLTKAALLDAVWGEIAVGEDALGFQIRALRQALRDDPRQSRYIETVHRIGYRFIAQVGVAPAAGVETTAPRPVLCDAGCERTASTVIGRGDEIARLDDLLTRTLEGRRQMAFVTGEAGIGKTALLEAFLASHKGSPFLVARGQSVEHYGAGEPLLPLLDAVSRLCRQPGGDRALGVLRRHAPSWLAHLPALWPAADREASPQMAPRVTRERMLRELCDALEVLTSVQPVVLLLEDLHWADPSTVEWLAMVARRPEAARLLVLGTYRPADLLFRAHPLKAAKQELVAPGQAIELALGALSRAAVATFVEQRLAGEPPDETRVALVHCRTEGHPLFMVLLVDLLAAGEPARPAPAKSGPFHVIDQTVPPRLRELVEAQLERLPIDEQRVLEVASVAGTEFTVASLAAMATMERGPVERVCEALARGGHFIEDCGLTRSPDGTPAGCNRFRYALYRDVLAARLGPGQRARLRAAIGTRKAPPVRSGWPVNASRSARPRSSTRSIAGLA